MLNLRAFAREKGSGDRLQVQTLASIAIVCLTSASGICFVGDAPATMGELTLRSCQVKMNCQRASSPDLQSDMN